MRDVQKMQSEFTQGVRLENQLSIGSSWSKKSTSSGIGLAALRSSANCFTELKDEQSLWASFFKLLQN